MIVSSLQLRRGCVCGAINLLDLFAASFSYDWQDFSKGTIAVIFPNHLAHTLSLTQQWLLSLMLKPYAADKCAADGVLFCYYFSYVLESVCIFIVSRYRSQLGESGNGHT